MDLNEHLAKIVEGLIAEINANVTVRVDSVISSAINNRVASFDFDNYISMAASAAFEKKVAEYTVDSKKLENRIVDKIHNTIDLAQTKTTELVETVVKEKLGKINLQKTINDSVITIIADRISEFVFPPDSIDPTALKLANLKISGDNVSGGLIENFSSTGIDDRASQIALTIFDENTVVENNLLTQNLTVEGSMTINGNFECNGNVSEDSNFFRKLLSSTTNQTLNLIDHNLFNSYSSTVFDKIKTEGLDLNKILLNGTEVLQATSLGKNITDSNLQTLGELKELTVSGESIFAQTLYVTPKRVGINTIEPSAALTVWDDEVEIVAKKKSRDVAIFGTSRQQKIVLTSNNKDNIVLSEDGSAQIDNLRIGTMQFTTANSPPNYVSERCHVVWNTNPNPGGPLGWICLGGANWANFGIID
jgi:hypothetical protein